MARFICSVEGLLTHSVIEWLRFGSGYSLVRGVVGTKTEVWVSLVVEHVTVLATVV